MRGLLGQMIGSRTKKNKNIEVEPEVSAVTRKKICSENKTLMNIKETSDTRLKKPNSQAETI